MAMMITKFHKIIQSKIVWGVFSAIIIIAFVGVYTPGAKSARQAQRKASLAGKLFGEEVDRDEYGAAYRSVYMMFSMMYGRPMEVNARIEPMMRQLAWQRLATLKKADQLGIGASADEVLTMIQEQPLFRGQNGQFDTNAYKRFVAGFGAGNGMTEQDMERMFSEQVIIRKMQQRIALGAVVTETEIKKAFHMQMDSLTVEYATIPRSIVQDAVVSDEEAAAYYEANKEQFRMPERVLVKYVEFPADSFKEGIEVSDDRLQQAYEQNKYRFAIEPAEDAPEGAETTYKPLEEVKEELTADIISAMALRKASDRAYEFVGDLSDSGVTFEATAAKFGVSIVDNLPGFARNEPVQGVDPTAPFQRVAFALKDDPSHYYSDPAVGRDSVYVLALIKKYESFIPPYEVVKANVQEAARLSATEKAYVQAAEAMHGEIKAALAAGTSFADLAAKNKLDIEKTEPFTSTTQLTGDFGREIKTQAVFYNQGDLCDLISTPDGFLMAYIAERVLADEINVLPGLRPGLVETLSNDKSARLVEGWNENILKEAEFEDLLTRSEDAETSADS